MHKSNNRQAGAVLIVLLFVFSLLLTALFMQKTSPVQIRLERSQKTQLALIEAKTSLMGRAILDENRPGSLPCPDANNDGSADLFYGNRCPSYIGRFPWRTLSMPSLQDADGETLWYALSANYRDHSAVMPLNTQSPGLLSVDAQSDVVAIVFSAGAPLAHQSGRPSTNLTDYLEGKNADADNLFSTAKSASHNDHLISITRSELMQKIERRALAEAANSLQYYFANPAHAYFPYAALLSRQCEYELLLSGYIPTLNATACPAALPVMAAWFNDNAWADLIGYEVAAACSKRSPNCSGSGFIANVGLEHVRVRLTMLGSGQKRIIQ